MVRQAQTGDVYDPLTMTPGLLVGIALAGAVILIEESLKRLKSITISAFSEKPDGDEEVELVDGVFNLLRSTPVFSFNSKRCR